MIKVFKYSLFSIVICSLFLIMNNIQAQAVWGPILDSQDISIVDGQGIIIAGNKNISMKNVIPINYVGTDMTKDIRVKDKNGEWIEPVISTSSPYEIGTQFKIMNVGYYSGKPMSLVFKSTNMYVIPMVSSRGVRPNLSTGLNVLKTNPEYELWLEDSDGNEINDSNVRFLLPVTSSINFPDNVYMTWDYSTGLSTAGNLLIRNSTKNDSMLLPYFYVDITNSYSRVIGTVTGTYYGNYIFPSGHMTIKSDRFKGSYPNGIANTVKTLNNSTIGFLDPTSPVILPLSNAGPKVNNTTNDSSFKVNLSVSQSLYGQIEDSFYSDELVVKITTPEILKTIDSVGNLVVKDSLGNDITNEVQITSEINGTVNVHVTKSTLTKLGNNIINIQGMIEIDQRNEKIMDYYDSDTGYFVFSETAQNTDSEDLGFGEAKVKMPGPTADPVSQTVTKDMTTNNLLPKDLVENLNSLVPDDEVTVIGFKEEKTFSNIGSDSVVVQIQSKKTGQISDIVVPVTVVSEPVNLDQINMSWELPNPDIVNDKNDEVSISTLKSGILTKELFWQSEFKNKQYMLVVKKGATTILTQKKTNNISTGDNSWLRETVDIPTDQLTIGANKITIIAYAFKSDGSLTGGPLDYLVLNLTVLDENAQLSWDISNMQNTKKESLDKSTMEESLIETLYWKTTEKNRNYLLVTKDSSGSVITSQAVSNATVINQLQQLTISFPTDRFNYGDNLYTVGIYAQDNTGAATGTALDVITLTVTVTGTLQLVSIPETIDFNLQAINSRKNVRVDNPTITGALVIADTRDTIDHSWTVKVSLTKEFENISDTGKVAVLQNVLRYKAPNKDEFIVTSDSQEIVAQADAYGKYDISSEWGNAKDSAGFKFETPPAYIGQLGEYTGEITYTISETYEP